jgi:hypothetical protein
MLKVLKIIQKINFNDGKIEGLVRAVDQTVPYLLTFSSL